MAEEIIAKSEIEMLITSNPSDLVIESNETCLEIENLPMEDINNRDDNIYPSPVSDNNNLTKPFSNNLSEHYNSFNNILNNLTLSNITNQNATVFPLNTTTGDLLYGHNSLNQLIMPSPKDMFPHLPLTPSQNSLCSYSTTFCGGVSSSADRNIPMGASSSFCTPHHFDPCFCVSCTTGGNYLAQQQIFSAANHNIMDSSLYHHPPSCMLPVTTVTAAKSQEPSYCKTKLFENSSSDTTTQSQIIIPNKLTSEKTNPTVIPANGNNSMLHKFNIQSVLSSNVRKNLRRGPRNKPLNELAVNLMEKWYLSHVDHPYPTFAEKDELARQGNVSVAQVNSWFANRRNRSDNTKPKKNRKQLQIRLYQFAKELEIGTNGCLRASDIARRLTMIIDEYLS